MVEWMICVRVAGVAELDPKTAYAYFARTRKLRVVSIRAIERALEQLGLEHLKRAA